MLMKYTNILLTILIISVIFYQPKVVVSPGAKFADSLEQVSNAQITHQLESRELDQRAKILQAYLSTHNAPLQHSAQDFVDAADKYNLDWKLVAAISGVESTFGKHVPGGTESQYSSFNGWGWGVYGTQAIYFKNWREGIFAVSKGLRQNYFDKGLTNPQSINRVYAASKTWGTKVTFFLNKIEDFEKEYKLQNPV